jgi:hypothetical protein
MKTLLFFICSHPGLFLVLIGVVGESVCDWKELKTSILKIVFVLLLVIGLVAEFWEAAKSDRDVAVLQHQTAVLVASNLELEKQIQPRRIEPEQRAEIIRQLHSWRFIKDKCSVKIRVQPSDVEAKIFAEQIGDMLAEQCGFQTYTDEGFNASFASAFGTKFTVHDPPPPGAREIARALKQLRIEPVTVDMSTNNEDGVLKIEVFPKALQ